SSGSGSFKRSNSLSSRNQKLMSCLVDDGYKSDFGKFRKYHMRHRVCKHHSKDPLVIVEGKELRFCQQCS
ncbi:Transcription factor, SBP-box, partial [Corchorus capsularis]